MLRQHLTGQLQWQVTKLTEEHVPLVRCLCPLFYLSTDDNMTAASRTCVTVDEIGFFIHLIELHLKTVHPEHLSFNFIRFGNIISSPSCLTFWKSRLKYGEPNCSRAVKRVYNTFWLRSFTRWGRCLKRGEVVKCWQGWRPDIQTAFLQNWDRERSC